MPDYKRCFKTAPGESLLVKELMRVYTNLINRLSTTIYKYKHLMYSPLI
jgi:hypothetical protein